MEGDLLRPWLMTVVGLAHDGRTLVRSPASNSRSSIAEPALQGVGLRVSLERHLKAARVSLRGARTAKPCEMSARVRPCQLALGPCHAEGRGFESLHPLPF